MSVLEKLLFDWQYVGGRIAFSIFVFFFFRFHSPIGISSKISLFWFIHNFDVDQRARKRRVECAIHLFVVAHNCMRERRYEHFRSSSTGSNKKTSGSKIVTRKMHKKSSSLGRHGSQFFSSSTLLNFRKGIFFFFITIQMATTISVLNSIQQCVTLSSREWHMAYYAVVAQVRLSIHIKINHINNC